MKKKDLIKIISREFELDEVKVSEYFDNIFETLAVAFLKNKNVNISEFGKFKVRTKQNEEGKKEKTVSFSPVKKFAFDINYNFNELAPVQIRILDDKSLSIKIPEGELADEETEEIIFIDFEDEQVTETDKREEVLIPEETKQEILQEEITPEEKVEEEKEEEVLIPEEKEKEKPEEIIPIFEESLEIPGSKNVLDEEAGRILESLLTVIIPPIKYFETEEKPEISEFISESKEVVSESIYAEEDKFSEEILTEPEEIKEAEIKEDEIPEGEVPEAGGFAEETETESADEIFNEAIEEQKLEEQKTDDLEQKGFDKVTEPEEKKVEDVSKSSLELEAELLQMLDERKKIMEEIRKLENLDSEDLIELSEDKKEKPGEGPKLFEEDMLDKPKQNVFIDENGKIYEKLLQDFKEHEEHKEPEDEITETPREIIEGEKIIPETEIPGTEEPVEDLSRMMFNQFNVEETENKEAEEKTMEQVPQEDGELDNLFNSIYGAQKSDVTIHEIKDEGNSLNSSEMNIFNKLLDEPVSEPKDIPQVPIEKITSAEKDEVAAPIENPENLFVNFKTEKSQVRKEKKTKEPEKTEAIKTYDDIFNLIEPNGKKKEKPSEPKTETVQKKKFPPILKLVIPIVIIIVVIIVSLYLYNRSVYKDPDENQQTQVVTADSTKTESKDTIIYADTNKTEGVSEGDIVYDEDGFVIRESEDGFFVHFGNFENQFELAKKIKELKKKNIAMEYEKVTIEGKEVYKIIAGPYKNLQKAKSVIPKL